MRLEDYQPECQLTNQRTKIDGPIFPVIEAHGHIEPWNDNPPSPEALVERMDRAGVKKFMDLDAGVIGPKGLIKRIDRYKGRYPDRFEHAAGIDWPICMVAGDSFGKIAAEQIREQFQAGARALKVWKNVGLTLRDTNNELIKVDDPRLNTIWDTAGELNMPVFLHVGDPIAFFEPVDERNERFEELSENPDWSFHGQNFPNLDEIITGLENVVTRFPKTVFIGAHVGCLSEDLNRVGALLDKCPNYNIDISARLNDLGRQPYSSAAFMKKYAERILFGTDTDADLETSRIWYRFLETRDEYFPYSTSSVPDQGRWNIYGIGLEDDILRKIYSGNAERLLFN